MSMGGKEDGRSDIENKECQLHGMVCREENQSK